jgi:glutamate formiminotransferase
LVSAVNISEGRDGALLDSLEAAGGTPVLDVHRDADHNRSVLTMAGEGLEEAVRAVARRAVEVIDLRHHEGVHPRFGAVDVVPFAPVELTDDGAPPAGLAAAVETRDRFASWAGHALALPCFLYGPERSLPEVRRQAFAGLGPDSGPSEPHPTAGACAVGARGPLVAYNLWLATEDLSVAKAIAAALRSPSVRALGLVAGGVTQVSCNLVDPVRVGPEFVYDEVDRLAHAAGTTIARAELVGLAPARVVEAVPRARRGQLDLDHARTVEARLTARRR